MRDKVEKFITEHGMLENVKNVVAGVSGGADSMCMLHILNQMRERYGYHLCVVHIHHGIRGKDADEHPLRTHHQTLPPHRPFRWSGCTSPISSRFSVLSQLCSKFSASLFLSREGES